MKRMTHPVAIFAAIIFSTAAVQTASLAEIGDPAGRQIVNRDDPMALGEQPVAQV